MTERPPPAQDRSAALVDALAALNAADSSFAAFAAPAGPPPLQVRPHGFPTLLRAIVSQQVSAASARAIWTRTEAAGAVTPAAVLETGETGLRALGFSRPKIRYALALADAVADGRLDLVALDNLEDEPAIVSLTALPGIGRWTAEVYLIFALGRPDLWPAADLALQSAQARLLGLEARPTARESAALAERWRPWRSAAAVTLWHVYRTMP